MQGSDEALELKLRKKGLFSEMQLLDEMHFQTEVILLQTPHTLVLANAIQQPNSFDRQMQHIKRA